MLPLMEDEDDVPLVFLVNCGMDYLVHISEEVDRWDPGTLWLFNLF